MVEGTLEEKLFRERYRQQLRELKDDHALEDERKKDESSSFENFQTARRGNKE